MRDCSAEKLAKLAEKFSLPEIRQYGGDLDKLPFDFDEVVAALAPRPVFLNAPLNDKDFNVVGVKKMTGRARKVYKLRNSSDKLRTVHPDCGHDFPQEVEEKAYQWLDQHLKPRTRG